MDPYPNWPAALLFLLAGALLAAGRTALTVLPDSAVKRMAGSENPKERRIAKLLEKPTAFLDGLELARLICVAAGCILLWKGMNILLINKEFVPESLAFQWGIRIVFYFSRALRRILFFIASICMPESLGSGMDRPVIRRPSRGTGRRCNRRRNPFNG